MAKMRAVQVARAGGALELVERDMPEPARGEVRVRVEACGVCHSDSLTVEGHMPGLAFPRIPGHEIAGVIDALGAGVDGWRVGQRVGVGWFGGHCGHCEPCRRGWLIDCRNLRIPGISYDGGYAEAMVVPADALAAIPDELGAAEAAPLLCAGVTTFNALRHSGAMPGDVVAILGCRRPRPSRRAVRKQTRLPYRRDRPRRRQGGAVTQARRAPLHRQRDRGRGGGTQPPRRRAGRAGDRHQRQGDDAGDRGARGARPAHRGGRRRRADPGLAAATDRREPQRRGSRLRRVDRIRRTRSRSARCRACVR